MNAFPEMLQCKNTVSNVKGASDLTVFERHRDRMKWQQEHQQLQQQQQSFFNENELNMYSTVATQSSQFQFTNDSGFANLLNCMVKPDPSLDNGWPDYGKLGGDSEYSGYGYGNELNFAVSRTNSCPSAAVIGGALENDTNGRTCVFPEQMNSSTGKDSLKKRKADKALDKKAIEAEANKSKKCKEHVEEGESRISTEQNNKSIKRETSNDTSKDNSKVSDVQKPDYIHVRARRGQATDSHSLAERVRREKISERMKYLQDLVPGCNKITGKAGMLDEIINYVQSLQKQVEFLSMKLATVNPQIDINIEDFFTKEQMFSACTSEMAADPAYLQFNTLQQAVTCGMNLGIDPSQMTLSTPVPNQETLVHSSCFNQIQNLATWDAELQNLYNAEFQQGSSTMYPSQPFTDCIEGTNLKMEM